MFAVNIDDNDELADAIITIAGQINAANYRFLKLLAEFDKREAWEGFGIRSCAHWLNWKCGIAMNAAREKVRVARALEELPQINASFEKGELSFSKVRAMTRAATAENEEYLLMIANHGTAQHVEVLVRAYRYVGRLNDNETEVKRLQGNGEDKQEGECQREHRKVSCYQDDNGMWQIQVQLPAEEGSLLVKLLKELGDRLEADAAKSQVETRVETIEEKVTAVTSFPQRRADALLAIAEHYLASGSDKTSSLKASDRCQLVMHVHTGSGIGAGLDSTLDSRWLAPDAVKRLACDASLLVVKQDDAGNVLDIGRKTRIIPTAISRALAIRDGGCQFPGCCETRYVDGHHIKHWADCGETKLDNLVTLCRHHHRELHKGTFFLCLKPESSKPERFADRLCFSKVERGFDAPFNRTEGFVIAPNPAKFTCACCDFSELEKTLGSDLFNSINKHTAVTHWLGERMDVNMALGGLMRGWG